MIWYLLKMSNFFCQFSSKYFPGVIWLHLTHTKHFSSSSLVKWKRKAVCETTDREQGLWRAVNDRDGWSTVLRTLCLNKLKHRKNCQCCPMSLFIEGSLWMLRLLISIVWNVIRSQGSQASRVFCKCLCICLCLRLYLCIVFYIVFLLARWYLIVTLINGHKSLELFFEGVF